MPAVGLLARKAARRPVTGKGGAPEVDDTFEMANLYPRETGLPMTVWVSPRGRARHAAPIKVCRRPGDRMVPDDTVSVRILPKPAVVAGTLSPADLDRVVVWVTLNQDVLLDYWNGTIGTAEMASQLRRV